MSKVGDVSHSLESVWMFPSLYQEFHEYLKTVDASQYLDFASDVRSFKESFGAGAEEQSQLDHLVIKAAAISIGQSYLGIGDYPKLKWLNSFDFASVFEEEEFTGAVFDDAISVVLSDLETFYNIFLHWRTVNSKGKKRLSYRFDAGNSPMTSPKKKGNTQSKSESLTTKEELSLDLGSIIEDSPVSPTTTTPKKSTPTFRKGSAPVSPRVHGGYPDNHLLSARRKTKHRLPSLPESFFSSKSSFRKDSMKSESPRPHRYPFQSKYLSPVFCKVLKNDEEISTKLQKDCLAAISKPFDLLFASEVYEFATTDFRNSKKNLRSKAFEIGRKYLGLNKIPVKISLPQENFERMFMNEVQQTMFNELLYEICFQIKFEVISLPDQSITSNILRFWIDELNDGSKNTGRIKRINTSPSTTTSISNSDTLKKPTSPRRGNSSQKLQNPGRHKENSLPSLDSLISDKYHMREFCNYLKKNDKDVNLMKLYRDILKLQALKDGEDEEIRESCLYIDDRYFGLLTGGSGSLISLLDRKTRNTVYIGVAQGMYSKTLFDEVLRCSEPSLQDSFKQYIAELSGE